MFVWCVVRDEDFFALCNSSQGFASGVEQEAAYLGTDTRKERTGSITRSTGVTRCEAACVGMLLERLVCCGCTIRHDRLHALECYRTDVLPRALLLDVYLPRTSLDAKPGSPNPRVSALLGISISPAASAKQSTPSWPGSRASVSRRSCDR